MFGESDMRFRVRGGNQSVAERLARELPEGRIIFETKLVKIHQPNKSYEVTLERHGQFITKSYDVLVLAIPFTTLRTVEMQVEMDDNKRWIIDNLGYGMGTRLTGAFNERAWRSIYNHNGTIYADNGLDWTWESSRQQLGKSGLITNLLGGNRSLRSNRGSAEDQFLETLSAFDEILPGVSQKFIPGSAVRMHWPTAPFHKGSYSCYTPGQWSRQGDEIRPVGNIFFCGEHTSEAFQGFMEGACETGARAAREILLSMKVSERAERVPVVAYQ